MAKFDVYDVALIFPAGKRKVAHYHLNVFTLPPWFARLAFVLPEPVSNVSVDF